MNFAAAKSFLVPGSAGSVATAVDEQARQQNLAVAEGLKRQEAGLIDELIVKYQHRLMRYLLYLTGHREQAEDLFQDVWMRVLVRGAQFNGQARFETWLFTIARNLVIDQRRKRTASSLDELFEAGNDEDRPMAFEVAGDEPTPFDRVSNLKTAKRSPRRCSLSTPFTAKCWFSGFMKSSRSKKLPKSQSRIYLQ